MPAVADFVALLPVASAIRVEAMDLPTIFDASALADAYAYQ